jgi:serine/threonine protein kinase
MTSLAAPQTLTSIGNYDLLDQIAQGGMATVFRARHRKTDELVAVKIVFPPHSNNEVLIKRFEQECRTSKMLQHPNIVRALDFGREGTNAYLVLEFVDGPDLLGRVDRDGPLRESEAVRLIVEAAQGLHHAHKHGIIHRDVKPDNILITPDGHAKLADLGLMKDLETDLGLTCRNKGMGTPTFMAPEQFRNAKHAGVRCDIYSLGATLYTIVTGQLPFDAKNLAALLQKKLDNDLIPPRKLVPALSLRLERAILRAVRADADFRPRTCLEFIDTLTKDSPESAPVSGGSSRRGAKPARSSEPRTERRASVRYPSNMDTACQRKLSIHLNDEEQDAWKASVRDLSTRGMGLLLSRRFEKGTILHADLQTLDKRVTRTVEIRVTRVDEAGRGVWYIGCTFTKPLTKEEVRSLL